MIGALINKMLEKHTVGLHFTNYICQTQCQQNRDWRSECKFGFVSICFRENHASCRAVALARVGGVDRHHRGVDSIDPDVWLCFGRDVVLL